ncbi:MAG: hypothetical protein Q9170_004037 [Blastenia crenularia]
MDEMPKVKREEKIYVVDPWKHPGKMHIVELLDHFDLEGPNGVHQCLVTNGLGPCLLPGSLEPELTDLGNIWSVAKQLVQAAAYMHTVGIVHGGESKAFFDPNGKFSEADLSYRAPELVFESQLSSSADIWSLGCSIAELVGVDDVTDIRIYDKDDMIRQWISVFGSLPEEWEDHIPPESEIGESFSSSVF